VTLHIYDVGRLEDLGPSGVQALNRCLRPLGTGAFHCGVEVFGQEWSFRSDSRGTGVDACRPKRCEDHTYSDSMHMGHTPLSKPEVLELIFVLEKEWPGISYDSLRRNCCHFCDTLCVQLGVGHLPPWITNLANVGAALIDTTAALEDTFCSASLFSCVCLRHPTPPRSDQARTKGLLEAQRKEAFAVSPLGYPRIPGRSPVRIQRYRHAFLERMDAMEVGGGADEAPCDEGHAEDPVFSKCASEWTLCSGSRNASPCCLQEGRGRLLKPRAE